MDSNVKPLLNGYYGIRLVTEQTRWWHEEGEQTADVSSLFCVHNIALDQPCAKCLRAEIQDPGKESA